MMQLNEASIGFGGINGYSSVSTSRTLMFKELSLLLDAVPANASALEYRQAIVDENVLLKPSASTRAKTYSYLRDRFGLDPEIPIFQVLRFLWEKDVPSQPLLALLVASYRDPIMRVTNDVILTTNVGVVVESVVFGTAINTAFPDRLKEKTLKSTGENSTSTYRQSGHLSRTRTSVRQAVAAQPGSTTMALLMATLEGGGGKILFQSDWVKLLDSPEELVIAEARIAASRGWLEYRQAGDVLEITFNRLTDTIGGLS